MIKRFIKYLKYELNFGERVVRDSKELMHYLSWLKRKKKKYRYVKHLDIVEYIEYLRGRGLTHPTIVNKVRLVRHFYDFLRVRINPVHGIKLRGREKKVLKGILTEEELAKLYNDVKSWEGTEEHQRRRDIAILGLIIFQGVKVSELGKIRLIDIGFGTNTVRIPGGKRIDERTLSLNPLQIIDLFQYIETTRKELQLRCAKPFSDKLFFPKNSDDILPIAETISRKMRKRYSRFENFTQLRNSVIVNWIRKGENLRKVQYKAGHRYVSSTEGYKIQNIEELKKKVNEFFPM